jgi:hypothetical protein
MIKKGMTIGALFAMGLLAADPVAGESNPASAVGTIEIFYRKYLGSGGRDRAKAPALPFSKSFQALLDADFEACKKKAGTDVCGWGTEGDVYLDAQEFDPELSYANSGIQLSEPKPHWVRVKLNVFPSSKKDRAFYDRVIDFIMIREGGVWVVDDVVTGTLSARKQIADEIVSASKK